MRKECRMHLWALVLLLAGAAMASPNSLVDDLEDALAGVWGAPTDLMATSPKQMFTASVSEPKSIRHNRAVPRIQRHHTKPRTRRHARPQSLGEDKPLELRNAEPFIDVPGQLQFGNVIRAVGENNRYLSMKTLAADLKPDTPEFELAPFEGAGGPGYMQCSLYEEAVRTKADSIEACHALCAEQDKCKLITYYPADAVTSKNTTGNGAGDAITVKNYNDWPRTCYLIQKCGEELQIRDTEGHKANTYYKVPSALDPEVDWVLVHPEDPHEHRAVQSGELVTIRSPTTGMYIAYASFQDNVPFVNSSDQSRIAQFRILTAVEAQNDVESTSRVQIEPKFGSIAPGELLLLLPQSNSSDTKRVDQYSVYSKEASGTLFVTDSTFIGWQLTVSDHDTCKGHFERDGLSCCEWIAIGGTNDGVVLSEHRKCCDRTLLSECFASHKRIGECKPTHPPNEALALSNQKRATWDRAEGVSAPLQVQQLQKEAAHNTALAQRREADMTVQDNTEGEAEWKLKANTTGMLLIRQPHRKVELDVKIAAQKGQEDDFRQKKEEALVKQTTAEEVEAAADAELDAAKAAATGAADEAERLKVEYEQSLGSGECCGWVTTSSPNTNPSVVKWECCSADQCEYHEHRTKTAHQECSWNGELTAEGCKCTEGFGGLDCSVSSSTQGCFSGERANGEKPEGLTACSSCYKCNNGPATVREDGVVTAGGSERCLLHSGMESLCLTCPEGSGLLRLGDQGAGWADGYKQMGECRKLPQASIKLASDHQLVHRMACVKQCHPTRSTVFAQSKLNWCSTVCSGWNKLKFTHGTNGEVDVGVLCGAVKDIHCHSATNSSVANIPAAAHQCFSHKKVQPKAVCFAKSDPSATCEGGGQNSAWLQEQVGDLNSAEGAGWCCFEHSDGGFGLPDWMAEADKPASYWCNGVAMRL